jgi:D-glycero-D-manno-heptose 1,7-bisphosphate phosphatase
MDFAESLIQEERRRLADQRGWTFSPATQAGDLN